MSLRFLVLVFLFAVACSSPGDGARSVESQVWSPYCPGRLLTDCSTAQARELRGQIEQKIDGGDSETEVLAWVREEYGDQVVARPEGSGTGLVIWLVPAALFLAGGLIVARFVSRNLDPSDKPNNQEETHADP